MVKALSGLAAALLVALLGLTDAAAQTKCAIVKKGDRQILQCGKAVSVEAQAGTRIESFDENGVELSGEGRVLARVRRMAGAQQPPEFQIRTPTAIASVRGTVWAMDIKPERTSVYVREGAVQVSRKSDGVIARLNPFQGVDVGRGVKFEKQTWKADRANEILNPFGLIVSPFAIFKFGGGLFPSNSSSK